MLTNVSIVILFGCRTKFGHNVYLEIKTLPKFFVV
jgi:hypothetical protein